MTPITSPTPTPSLVKTSLDKIQVQPTPIKPGKPVAGPIKLWGGGGGVWGIFFYLPFPLYEFFRLVYVYFLGLLGEHEFFY